MAHAALDRVAPSDETIEVLLVDDDAAQREMYRRRLERVGWRVRVVDSADAATREVRTRPPQAVVLDIAMPGRDGLSCLQELIDIRPALPVIINTAYPAFVDNFLTWTADAYVHKTSDPGPLLSAIREAIGIAPDE